MNQNVLRQERSDDHKLASSVWCRCQTNEGVGVGGCLISSSSSSSSFLAWRPVRGERQDALEPTTEGKERPSIFI